METSWRTVSVLLLVIFIQVYASKDFTGGSASGIEYDCEKTPKSITNCTKDNPYCYNSTLSIYRPCWEICPDRLTNSSESECVQLCGTYLREKCRERSNNFTSAEMTTNTIQSNGNRTSESATTRVLTGNSTSDSTTTTIDSSATISATTISKSANDNRLLRILIGTCASLIIIIVFVYCLREYRRPPTRFSERGYTMVYPPSKWSFKLNKRYSQHFSLDSRALPGEDCVPNYELTNSEGNNVISDNNITQEDNLEVKIERDEVQEDPVEIELQVPVQASQPTQ